MSETTDFWVGDRFVRPSLGKIQLGPERVHLEPRSMEVLLALASRPGEVFPKQELIDAVWGDTFVSDEVLTHAIWDLRRAFGDNASDPEFIQTIPKRGYRLIAPVKPVGRPRRRATDRPARRLSSRILLLGLAAVALLLWIGLQLGARRARVDPAAPGARHTVLLGVGAPDGPASWGNRLRGSLGAGLAGGEIEVVPVTSCADGADGPAAGRCLQADLQYLGDRYEVVAQLFESPRGALEYAASEPVSGTGNDLEEAASKLGEKVRTYFQVLEDPFFRDPDIQPWFSIQKHDIRAIRDFLLGLAYVYRNETGGRHALAAAIQIERDFVAPRVFRTPTVTAEEGAEARAEHRAALERLYPGATAFEKPMIMWALALMDGDPAEQIRHLRIALGKVSGNRQIEYVLGFTLAGRGDLEEAWRYIGPLVGRGWHFPGLYSTAAEIALLRDQIDDIRTALERARDVEPVDPEALAVMIALAIYDEDAAREDRFRRRLDLRRRELAPRQDLYRFQVPVVAEALARRAASEGRTAVAARLRESAD